MMELQYKEGAQFDLQRKLDKVTKDNQNLIQEASGLRESVRVLQSAAVSDASRYVRESVSHMRVLYVVLLIQPCLCLN